MPTTGIDGQQAFLAVLIVAALIFVIFRMALDAYPLNYISRQKGVDSGKAIHLNKDDVLSVADNRVDQKVLPPELRKSA